MIGFGFQVTIVLLLMSTSLDLTMAYRHTVVVSNNFSLKCKLMIGRYHCGSLAQTFNLLNKIKTSVNVKIEPAAGEYSLVSSYNLTDLHDIKISSAVESIPFNISCRQGKDDGIAFIRSRNLLIQYMHIKWCGMIHVSTSQDFISKQFVYLHSALYFQNSTDVSITNSKIYDNNGIGVVIIDCNGTISITHSEFRNNSLNLLEQSVNLTGGGGLYIEFTKCTPGLPNCDPSKNLYNQQARYFVDQCKFDANTNTYISPESDHPANIRHVTFGCGGGLSIWLFGNADGNLFYISSKFSGNKANRGGGFTIDFRDNSTNTIVTIFQCDLTGNVATHFPGGAGASIGYVIYHFYERLRYNIVKLTECNFTGNIASNGSGGGLKYYGSHETDVTTSTNYIEVNQCHFERNVARFGSALAVAKEYYEVIPRGVLLTFVITNCSFIGNNGNNANESFSVHGSNYHSQVGAIAVTGFTIQFRLCNHISNHNTTALVMDDGIAEFYYGSAVTFSLNRGLKGGAILLLQGSWLKLFPNVTITFQNNTAIKSGGAIFVEMISPYDFLESHICFMRYYNNTSPSNWNGITVEFSYNSNPTIFASTLHPCDKEYDYNINFLFHQPFSYTPPINKTHNVIATLPNQIHVSQKSLSKSPGRTFELPVYLTDELNQNVTNSIFIVSCNSAYNSPHVLPLYQYTNGSVQIVGKPTETCHLELQTDDNYQISAVITVHLSKCPPGYVFDDQAQKCDCLQARYKLSGNPVILRCDQQFQAYVNPAYWVGFETDNATTLVAAPCPFGYCYGSGLFHMHDGVPLIQEANKMLLDQHVCGNVSRTGILCGKCIKNHSVAMNSPEYSCQDCKHHRFGALLFIVYYIIPVTILFYLIMTFNIRVTSGLFGAFLFFAQIIGSEINLAFGYRINAATRGKEFNYPKFIISLYNIFNLDFFQYDTFSYCLLKNAGAVDILAVKLLASLYPLGLVAIYSLVRAYCGSRCLHRRLHHCRCLCHCRFVNRAVTSGLSAFSVLCFARINVLAFAILKPVNVEHFDSDSNKWKSYKTVVYLQGSLDYFQGMHILYVIEALILLIAAIAIPTALLLIHPLLLMLLGNLGMGESKLMKCIECCLRINKLIPLLGSFQGDYKNNMKFFAGLHFFLYKTIVLCALIVIPTSSIGTLQLILIVLFLIILIIHIITNPFRKQVDNIAYSMLYLLIIVLFGILYLFISDEAFSFATYLGTALSSLPLLCLGGYFLSVLLRKIVFRIRYKGYVNINNRQD